MKLASIVNKSPFCLMLGMKAMPMINAEELQATVFDTIEMSFSRPMR